MPTDGIFYISRSDSEYRPPKYEDVSEFINLISKITSLGVEITFESSGASAIVLLNNSTIDIKEYHVKESEYHHIGYCFSLALKNAAAKLAETQ